MSVQSDQIIAYFQTAKLDTNPDNILVNYDMQFGLWEEESNEPNKRYFLIQQSGGAATNIVLEQPNYNLFIFGKEKDQWMGANDTVGEVADDIMKFLKLNPSYECFALIKEISAAIGPGKTDGNRPFYIINIRTITTGG